MKIKLLSVLIASCVAYSASACTGISLSTVNHDYIQARTIEWGQNDLNSKLIVSPRDYSYVSTMPDQKQGLKWDSKYGFVGISVSDDRFIAEGLNDKISKFIKSTVSVNEKILIPSINLYPNPSPDYIQLNNLNKTENYIIYNSIGSEINKGKVDNNEKIDVQNLMNGYYLLKFEDGQSIGFIKE